MLYLCMGGFKKRLKESMKKKLARISRSEAENRNSTIPTARETLLDNTVTNGSRANSLRYLHLSCIEHFHKTTVLVWYTDQQNIWQPKIEKILKSQCVPWQLKPQAAACKATVTPKNQMTC